jgi:hypothetical protein
LLAAQGRAFALAMLRLSPTGRQQNYWQVGKGMI